MTEERLHKAFADLINLYFADDPKPPVAHKALHKLRIDLEIILARIETLPEFIEANFDDHQATTGGNRD